MYNYFQNPCNIQKYENQFSAEDILDHYEEKKTKLHALTNDKVNAMIQKMANDAKNNDKAWTVDQAYNACEFVRAFSGEMQVSFFNKIMDCGNLDTIMRVHKIIGRDIVDLVNTSDKVVK